MQWLRNTQTRRLDDSALLPQQQPQSEFAVEISVPKKIALVINHLRARVILQITEPVVVGRAFSEKDEFGFLDLQLFGASEKGTSRRHLRLWSENGELFIEDLASLNGTRFNGTRLPEHSPQRIHDGAQLMLGRLEVTVEYINEFLG